MAITEVVGTSGTSQKLSGATGALAQTSTNATVVVTGSEIDARGWDSLSYTITVATNAVKWSVFGANVSDYSDEVAVLAAATVAGAAASSYVPATKPPFSFYRVKVIDDVLNTHGTIIVNGSVH